MELGSFHLKAEMSFLVNLCWIKGKAMVIISGQIIEGSRDGGMRTNNMVSESTLAQMRQVSSLGCGRWVSASSGLQMPRATKSGWANLTTLNFSVQSICQRMILTPICKNTL